MRKAKIAETRSDLSADSSDDRETRHQRCRIAMSSDELPETAVSTGVQSIGTKPSSLQAAVRVTAATLPVIPIPQGLQQATSPSLCMFTRFFAYYLCKF